MSSADRLADKDKVKNAQLIWMEFELSGHDLLEFHAQARAYMEQKMPDHANWVAVFRDDHGVTHLIAPKKKTVDLPTDSAMGHAMELYAVRLASGPTVLKLLLDIKAASREFVGDFEIVPTANSEANTSQDVALAREAVTELLYAMKNKTPQDMLHELSVAKVLVDERKATPFYKRMKLLAPDLQRMIATMDNGAAKVLYEDSIGLDWDTDFDEATVEGTKTARWCEERMAFEIGTLKDQVDDLAYLERAFLFIGPPNTNKTRACFALARKEMQEMLTFDADDKPMGPHMRYGVFVRSVDSLKEFRSVMKPYVPIIMDEINVQNIGCRPLTGDSVKAIVDVEDKGTLDCKNGDAVFVANQPRFMTTNRSLRDWLPASVAVPTAWGTTDPAAWDSAEVLSDTRGTFNDVRAILRRVVLFSPTSRC